MLFMLFFFFFFLFFLLFEFLGKYNRESIDLSWIHNATVINGGIGGGITEQSEHHRHPVLLRLVVGPCLGLWRFGMKLQCGATRSKEQTPAARPTATSIRCCSWRQQALRQRFHALKCLRVGIVQLGFGLVTFPFSPDCCSWARWNIYTTKMDL